MPKPYQRAAPEVTILLTPQLNNIACCSYYCALIPYLSLYPNLTLSLHSLQSLRYLWSFCTSTSFCDQPLNGLRIHLDPFSRGDELGLQCMRRI